jgi:hypothetical protein
MPQEIDDKRGERKQRSPKNEVLGAVAKNSLPAFVEGFSDELQTFLSRHFFVLFHCINCLTCFGAPKSCAVFRNPDANINKFTI